MKMNNHKIPPRPIIADKNKIKLKREPLISIIIPTKGNIGMLTRCLTSIEKNTDYTNYSIYIVDTGSTDQELHILNQYVRKNLTKVKLLLMLDWYNFAKLNNLAVEKYIDPDTELILFCNNDIEVLNNAISRMVEVYLSNPTNCGTIGARLHYPNGSIQHDGILGFITSDSKSLNVSHKNLGTYTYDNARISNVFGNTFAFTMVPKKSFVKLNEQYIECFEDVEFNLQMILNNKQNMYVGDAVCIHKESYTRGFNPKTLHYDYAQRLNPFWLTNYRKIVRRLNIDRKNKVFNKTKYKGVFTNDKVKKKQTIEQLITAFI